MEIAKNGDAAFKSIGLGVTYGDQRAQVNAIITFINSHGGAGGRPVKAVFYENDLTSTDSYDAREQRACTTWTQDNHVALVVSPMWHTQLLANCLKAHRVPFFNTGSTLDKAGLDAAGDLFLVNRLNLTRAMDVYVEALWSEGFFAKGTKVGLIYADSEPYRTVREQTLKPALRRHGITIVKEAGINNLDQGAYASGSQSAVLQFASAGVDRVLFVESGGGLPYMFSTDAEAQQYRPRYGFSSENNPAYLTTAMPKAQLHDAQGIGWRPVTDGGQRNATLAPGGRACVKIEQDGRQTSSSDTQSDYMANYCDMLLLVQRVLTLSGGHSDVTSLVAAANHVDRSFRSAATFSVLLDDNHHDGAASARPFAYREECSCFDYSGALRSIA